MFLNEIYISKLGLLNGWCLPTGLLLVHGLGRRWYGVRSWLLTKPDFLPHNLLPKWASTASPCIHIDTWYAIQVSVSIPAPLHQAASSPPSDSLKGGPSSVFVATTFAQVLIAAHLDLGSNALNGLPGNSSFLCYFQSIFHGELFLKCRSSHAIPLLYSFQCHPNCL